MCRGQVDDPLSEKGWQQMWDAVGDYRGWQHIVTSPLSRCSAFAEALAARLGVDLTLDARLMEGSLGEWEGRLPDEICTDDPERLFRYKCDPLNNAPQGAEPLAAFYARMGQAWQEILARSPGRHVLVVGHAGTVRMILAHMLGLPYENVYRINVGNAGLTRIRVEWNNGVALPSLLFHGGSL